jgi:hypothetical protein
MNEDGTALTLEIGPMVIRIRDYIGNILMLASDDGVVQFMEPTETALNSKASWWHAYPDERPGQMGALILCNALIRRFLAII